MKRVKSFDELATDLEKHPEPGSISHYQRMRDARERLRPLPEIVKEIRADWKNVYFGAVPYLDAMETMNSVKDYYGADSGKSIVLYFLSNARSWRGDVAKRVKSELLGMTK